MGDKTEELEKNVKDALGICFGVCFGMALSMALFGSSHDRED